MPPRAVKGWAAQGTPCAFGLVRGGGLEPPHHCWRQDLNLVRLPISPPAQKNSATRQMHPANAESPGRSLEIG